MFFLKKFFTEITGGNVDNPSDPDPKQRARSVSGASGAPAPVITVGQPECPGEERTPQELLMKFDEMQQSLASQGSVMSSASVVSSDSDRTEQSQPVFIKYEIHLVNVSVINGHSCLAVVSDKVSFIHPVKKVVKKALLLVLNFYIYYMVML